ncbi:hypothetical protein EG68_03153 [Paragonimus skrjabini miyazakii]|uniref:Sodium-dependent multivitamin transporter n=1 Tax=Paragonimus skrjabini miyazakii TaxID=59628 RepID=A0A8S9Z351_9TREM|nr:hypothetical protein EG68_03153 [Paragonimus skrjabini miyazakii]
MAFTFGWSDYLIFALLLVVYALIGIYQRFHDPIVRKLNRLCCNEKWKLKEHSLSDNTAEALTLGNRRLTLFPIMSSVMASFLSAVSLMGTASEAYLYGFQFILMIVAYFIAFSVAAEVYMPVFYKLRLVSAHEYLELRFGKAVRWTTSLVYCFQMIVYIALALYAPALAFSQVSGLPIWVSVLSTGLVTTFYTALGGIRAVVWTDVVQLVFLTTGLLTVVSVGVVRVGGMEQLWRVAYEGLRVQSFDVDPNPFKRHTIWTLMIGGAGMVLSIYATNQTQVQRYLACRDLRTAQLSILLNIPLNALFLFVQLMAGLVSYVYFAGCDPISSGSVSKSDQILPYIVMVLFDGIPVIRGLFLSVIFAAAISTVSSGVNSLATVLLEDIFRPLLLFVRKRDISERKRSLLAVIFSIVVGLCTIGMSFVFMVMGPRVLQFSFSLFGAVGGPILAVFTLGMVIPCVNWQGALAGLLCSLAVGLGLTVGGILYPGTSGRLPLSTENCTAGFNSSIVSIAKTIDPSWSIFHLSYLYYTLVCVCTAIVIAIPFSAIFKFNTKHLVPGQLLAWQTRAIYRRLPSCFPNQWEETPQRQPRDDLYRSMDSTTFLTTRTFKDVDGIDNEQFSEEWN